MSIESILKQYQKNKFYKDKKNLIQIFLALILNILTWLYIFVKFQGQEIVVLHYNLLSGIDFIGRWQKLLIIPLVGSCILIIHFCFSFYLYILRNVRLANFLIILLLIFQICLFVSVYLISNLSNL
ncbi:hypothetical protein ISS06_02345 [Patescibacteria group bacterium]|nr:hypothetical protein [Patescibacteria group bacterium]